MRIHIRRTELPGPKALLAAVVAAGLLGGCMAPPESPEGQAAQLPPADDRPNVLVIMTDDQPVNNTLKMMPKTRRWFGRGGTTFANTFATTPLCCPSRASIFTGRYAHNHEVHNSFAEQTQNLDHNSTMQRYLSDAGYRNAIFGKYLNGWNVDNDPPFFHDWSVIPGGKAKGYYGGEWNVDGTRQTIQRYSTNYIRERGLRFLDSAEQEDERPWMMFLNVYAPHQPALVPSRFKDVGVPKWRMNPARSEKNLSDKPPFARRWDGALAKAKETYYDQMRTLVPVDRMVNRVMTRLQELGEGRSTLAFFISDNGYMLAEHGLLRKSEPYTQSVKIPMMARWPGRFDKGVRDRRVAANMDIAPTVYEVADVTTDEQYPVDGLSLLGGDKRRNILLEYWQENPDNARYVPWASLRSKRLQYVEYYRADNGRVRFREYYNLRRDPWQLKNLLHDGDRSNNPDLSRIKRRLSKLRQCSGDSCR